VSVISRSFYGVCHDLWVSKTNTETVIKLKSRGIRSIVCPPCANRPETGDYHAVTGCWNCYFSESTSVALKHAGNVTKTVRFTAINGSVPQGHLSKSISSRAETEKVIK